MQLLPADVLQELQQQTQEEGDRQGGRLGAETGRGRRVGADSSPETREASFPFPATDRTYTTPPQTPALNSEGPGVSRWEALQVSGPARDRAELALERPPLPTLARPRDGSGAPSAPSRSRTAETVPPQLLGGRAGSDAVSLRKGSPDSFKDYRTSQMEATNAQLRTVMSSNPVAVVPISKPSSRATTWEKSAERSRSVTPVSRQSSPVNSISSLSSGNSPASSFAFDLRRRLPDLRLLKKKSKPLQHLVDKPKTPTPEPARPPSFYQPQVMVDNGFVPSTTASIKPPSPPQVPIALNLPHADGTDPPIKPLRRTQTLSNRAPGKLSVPKRERPQRKWPALARAESAQAMIPPQPVSILGSSPVTSPTPALLPPNPPITRHLRFQSQQVSGLRSSGAERSQRPPQLKELPRKLSMSQQQVHFSAITPSRGVFLASGSSSQAQHDYFMAFPTDTTHGKEFTPALSPVSIEQSGPRSESPSVSTLEPPSPGLPESISPAAHPLVRAESSAAGSKKGKRSSVFTMFRKSAFNNNVFGETELSATLGQSPGSLETPDILVHSPDGAAQLKRRLSSMLPETPLPPYFSRPKFRRGASEDASPSQSPRTASPMPTIKDDEVPTQRPRRSRYHNRSSSEQLSPTAVPRHRPRLARYRHTQEIIHGDTRRRSPPSPGQVNTSQSLPTLAGSITNPSPKASASFESASFENAQPTQNLDVEPSGPDSFLNTARKKSSIPKNMFQGLRTTHSVDLFNTREMVTTRRELQPRPSIAPWTAFRRLSVRASRSAKAMMKPRAKSSHNLGLQLNKPLPDLPTADDESRQDSEISEANKADRPKRVITAADLEITEFEQTPFSQRYNDSKRALQQQIRSLVQEGMDEDNDEDEDIVLGFEQDVPDHFPNSPLCPLHPKHKSGGKAICPLHGRYKKATSNAVVRVGPARSRRVLSVQSLGPLVEGEAQARPVQRHQWSGDSIPSKNKMEIVFDTMILEQTKARTGSMGSDGAGLQPSPTRSGEQEEVDWKMERRRMSESEMRGRKTTRAECGSRRTRRRRHRMCRR